MQRQRLTTAMIPHQRIPREGGFAGCLENFSCHRYGHRFKMHPIPEMLNPPGEPIYCVVSSSLIKIVNGPPKS